MKNLWILLIVLLSLALTGCAPSQIEVAESSDLPLASSTKKPISTQGDDTQINPFLPTLSNSGLENLIEKAKGDLAQRLGVSIDSITVISVIGQEFSTDAFNCQTSKERIAKEDPPQVVSGQSILLSASGHRYEYHASSETVIFCRPLP